MREAGVTSENFEFRPVQPLLRVFLVVAGVIFTGLWVLAWFIPALPSMPFLLLAVAAFARSSRRLHTWLTANRYLGPHLRTWRRERAVDGRVKLVSLGISWTIAITVVVFVAKALWLQALLVGVVAAQTVAVFMIKTPRPAPAPKISPASD